MSGIFKLLKRGSNAGNTDNILIVESASDLAGDLRSDVAYYISGIIDMGEQKTTVPQGGLTLIGAGFNVSKLTSSSANYTLFVDDGVYAGDLFLESMTCEITGASSKVFDLDNAGNGNAVGMDGVNFDNCTSIGTLDNYRQLLARNIAFIAPQDGIEFAREWSGGGVIVDSIMRNVPSGVTCFKAGAGFLVGSSFRSNMNAISIDDNAVVCDFAESNFTPDGSFLLDDFRTNPDAEALPNISETSTKCKFISCTGIRNTYPGGAWTISSSVATIIPDTVTLVKMAGVTAYSDLQWFTGDTDNAIKYASTLEIDITITGILSFSGSNNNECVVQIRKWDDSATAYVNVGPEFTGTLNGGPSGGRGENIPFQGITTINKDDRIEVWIRNNTAANNITGIVGGEVIVAERAS